MGVEVAINDAVSISYSSEEHEAVDKGVIAVGATTMTETTVTTDVAQISYNIGGATVGLFHVDTNNSDFSEGNN